MSYTTEEFPAVNMDIPEQNESFLKVNDPFHHPSGGTY